MTTKANLAMLRKAGSLHPDNNINISRTVRDAVNISRSLGHRYIWVDYLCIVQDDQDALSRSLNAMHQIYANSALCLVALAGKDADHGLRGVRGVSKPRNLENCTFNLAGGDQLSYFDSPRPNRYGFKSARLEHKAGSAWDKRGWAFQEFIFSRRRLLFTDGPLRRVCSTCNEREEEAYKTKMIPSDPVVNMPSVNWQTPYPSLTWIRNIASDFNIRHFRLPEDAPRAFLGVQNVMNSYFNGGLLCGHPEMFFDRSLLWYSKGSMKRRVTSTGVTSQESILPRWSWLGWRGNFYFLGDPEHEEVAESSDGFVEPVTRWFAMKSPTTSPSEMRPIKSGWHHYKMLAQDEPEHVPDGWEKAVDKSGSSCYGFAGRKLYYPVPVPLLAEETQPTPQLPFILAQTSRAFFSPRRARSHGYKTMNTNLIVDLYSRNQDRAGFLQLHDMLDRDRFLSLKTVELVTVAKGWSKHFDESLIWDTPQTCRISASRRDCYFVLCIE